MHYIYTYYTWLNFSHWSPRDHLKSFHKVTQIWNVCQWLSNTYCYCNTYHIVNIINLPIVVNIINLSIVINIINLPIVVNIINLPIVVNIINLSIVVNIINLPIVINIINLPIVVNLMNLPIAGVKKSTSPTPGASNFHIWASWNNQLYARRASKNIYRILTNLSIFAYLLIIIYVICCLISSNVLFIQPLAFCGNWEQRR
jgi:hypothetical protein